MYEEAIENYREALSFDGDQKAEIYSMLGFTHQLRAEFDEAITYYHSSLGLRPGDLFTTSMLDTCMRKQFSLRKSELKG